MHDPDPVRRPERELVTIAEMARRVSMTPDQFVRLARRMGIPKVKLGHKTVRYEPDLVIELLTARFATATGAGTVP